MAIFFPEAANGVELRLNFGTTTDRPTDYTIQIDRVGDFIVPKSIQTAVEADPNFKRMSGDEKARYLLRQMLNAAQRV